MAEFAAHGANQEEKMAAEKAKKTTKYTLFSTQELTENNQRPINKAQKVMTIHIINNVRVPYIIDK